MSLSVTQQFLARMRDLVTSGPEFDDWVVDLRRPTRHIFVRDAKKATLECDDETGSVKVTLEDSGSSRDWTMVMVQRDYDRRQPAATADRVFLALRDLDKSFERATRRMDDLVEQREQLD
jgi:hypothetical protein